MKLYCKISLSNYYDSTFEESNTNFDFIKGKYYEVVAIIKSGYVLLNERGSKHKITKSGWVKHFLTPNDLREIKLKRIVSTSNQIVSLYEK